MDSERDAYDAWASTTLGDAEEPWTGDMAEEGLTAEDAEGECFGILNDTPRPCAYSFMAARWASDRCAEAVYAMLMGPQGITVLAAPKPIDIKVNIIIVPDALPPSARNMAVNRAIGRHVAGGLQIGLRTP